MRKIYFFLGVCMALLASCSSSNGPTGDAEKDAKQFADGVFSACKANDIDKMEEIVNVYYDFYKDQDAENIKHFLEVWKDENDEYNYSKYGIDEDQFSTMALKADKEGKMNRLYREYYN